MDSVFLVLTAVVGLSEQSERDQQLIYGCWSLSLRSLRPAVAGNILKNKLRYKNGFSFDRRCWS
jgi:hypothetical protein